MLATELLQMVVFQVDLMHKVVLLEHTVRVSGAHMWAVVLVIEVAEALPTKMRDLDLRPAQELMCSE